MQTMTYAASVAVLVARACTRCGHELEDPASVQSGQGPICRGFTSAVLAKEIPTAWDAEAQAGLFMLSAESFEAEGDRERFEAVYMKIMTSKGANSPEAVTGEDARKLVRELAYLASAAPSRTVYEILIKAIRGLGYPAYAAAVSGESSSGEAALSFENGSVYLKAVRNPAGRAALRRLGAYFSSLRGDRWYVPASKAEAFIAAARLYWPMVTGAEETLEAAKKATAPAPAPAPAPVATPEPVRPVEQVVFQWGSAEFLLVTPYRGAFVAALKALPGGRRWDSGLRAWRIARAHEAQVRAMVAAHFPEAAVIEQ
jgi:hypothetical protein